MEGDIIQSFLVHNVHKETHSNIERQVSERASEETYQAVEGVLGSCHNEVVTDFGVLLKLRSRLDPVSPPEQVCYMCHQSGASKDYATTPSTVPSLLFGKLSWLMFNVVVIKF